MLERRSRDSLVPSLEAKRECGMMATPNKILLYTPNMAAKPVQISLEPELLERIDADHETRTRGRSAFIRAAVERYLAAKARRRIDSQIEAAYARGADKALRDAEPLIDAQAWPDD